MRILLAATLLVCTGCAAQWCHLPDDCACALRHTQLGWELHDVCHNCPLDCCLSDCAGCCDAVDGCGVRVYDDSVYLDPPRHRVHRQHIEVGPPPERYEPPMPPKFLPVPARSVFAATNVHAPVVERGQVEFGYGHSLSFPAGD